VLSERLLSAVLRRAGDRSLRLQPYEERRLPAPVKGREYLLYAHIPFCRKRCHFCYFKVYTDKDSQEIRSYLDAVLAEELRTRVHALSLSLSAPDEGRGG